MSKNTIPKYPNTDQIREKLKELQQWKIEIENKTIALQWVLGQRDDIY